jgi:CPA1 family monovalent cation:H+ antiporter
MFDTALVLFVLAGFLIVVAISQPVATWLKLPQSVVLAAIGIGIGALPAIAGQLGLPGQIDVAANLFAKLPVNSAIFIYVFLPLLVFEAGVATDVKRTIEDAAPILRPSLPPLRLGLRCGHLHRCLSSFVSCLARSSPPLIRLP